MNTVEPESTMNTAEPEPTIDLAAISRAVTAVAIGVAHTIERAMAGDTAGRTARDNAWAAICADRDRAQQREEVRRMVAALTVPKTDELAARRDESTTRKLVS
ncbi:hypothetical protein ACWDV4_09010 [Micromonospora sp. NPDC003197]